MKASRFIFVILLVAACFFLTLAAQGAEMEGAGHTLFVFYSSSCRACLEVNNTIIPLLQDKFKGRLNLEFREIGEIENYRLLLSLREKYGIRQDAGLPVFFLNGRFLSGEKQLAERLERFIEESIVLPAQAPPELPAVDLVEHFKGFKPLAIVSAGLVDGINPCAFTVMVFFISFLAFQKYRRRDIVIISLAFIFSVFATYILVGVGLFGFLYRLKGFWALTRAINIGIGTLSLILGALSFYDYLKFKLGKGTGGLVIQLPQAVKNRIHWLIGLHYRKTPGAQDNRTPFILLLSALVTGFLVSLLEAVCTGQLYLPTIIFVLKTTHLKLEALGYILLYNTMFIVPLFIIFLCALFGVTSEQFAQFLKKHLGLVKILMALVFFLLGASLVYSQASREVTKAGLEESSPVFDFGKAREGKVLHHTFVLKNKTSRLLGIKQIDTSCGCTLSKVKKKFLSPGESTEIEVSFNTAGYSGPVQQFVYVHTDDLDNPVRRFIIKADVFK